MMNSKTMVLLGALLVFSTGAMAKRNQAKETRREVRKAAASGELSKEEMKGIQKKRKDIRVKAEAAREDGTVSKEERTELREMKKNLSENVKQEASDGEKGPAHKMSYKAKQNKRIQKAVKSGKMSAQDGESLRAEMKSIQEKRKGFMADGELSESEKAELSALRKSHKENVESKMKSDK